MDDLFEYAETLLEVVSSDVVFVVLVDISLGREHPGGSSGKGVEEGEEGVRIGHRGQCPGLAIGQVTVHHPAVVGLPVFCHRGQFVHPAHSPSRDGHAGHDLVFTQVLSHSAVKTTPSLDGEALALLRDERFSLETQYFVVHVVGDRPDEVLEVVQFVVQVGVG